MSSKVSILIPVYNRVNLVGESIESAINQTYKNIEIIIVDNCSTDGTWQVLENYAAKDSRIRIFRNSENVGPVLNWKRCIDEAKGEYAKILFSDDLISENFVEETIKLFDRDTAFVLGSVKVFSSQKGIIEQRNKKEYKYSKLGFLLSSLIINYNGFSVSPGCAIFRLSDLAESLIIDIPNHLSLEFKRYGAGNDLLLFLNTAVKYKNIKLSNSVVAFFRKHDNSFTISENLTIYYVFAKYYFIKNNMKELLPLFKMLLFVRSFKRKSNKETYNLMRNNENY
jgi:glycosyltransferase involved in cell wall biosynthesis